jgi:hypothetical protein
MKKDKLKWFTVKDKELVEDWSDKGKNLVTGLVYLHRKDLYMERRRELETIKRKQKTIKLCTT